LLCIRCLRRSVPLFFKRGADGLPHEWIEVMKRALGSSIYSFSTRANDSGLPRQDVRTTALN
jgi:hypothetical protein